MSPLNFLRSRYWIMGRRLALVAVILFLALRNYGGAISSWFRSEVPEHGVVLIKSEFRPDLGEEKPAWIIGLRNENASLTYNQIELEATYWDKDGKVLETDKLVVTQKLEPGGEQLIASTDFKNRPGATAGTLKVIGAKSATP